MRNTGKVLRQMLISFFMVSILLSLWAGGVSPFGTYLLGNAFPDPGEKFGGGGRCVRFTSYRIPLRSCVVFLLLPVHLRRYSFALVL